MQVVIDIPEDRYQAIKSARRVEYVVDTYTVGIAIADGTPLPKGHGRLIDADVVVDGMEENYELCIAVNDTPTIIEADKENK